MSDPEITTDVKQAVPVQPEPAAVQQETITEPAKLLRIASMVRELLEETRHASLDEAGRTRLADVYERSVQELGGSISPDLQEELAALSPPVDTVPSESEIRIAQAQLVGWLEGLFQGIQTALMAQQMAARAQLEQMRRGLPAGAPHPGPGVPEGMGRGTGQYL
jgi:Bacterial proteasome activator